MLKMLTTGPKSRQKIGLICWNTSQGTWGNVINILLLMASSFLLLSANSCENSSDDFFRISPKTVYIYAISAKTPSGNHINEDYLRVTIDEVNENTESGSIIIKYESITTDLLYGGVFYLNSLEGTFADKDMKEKGNIFTLFPNNKKAGSKWTDAYNDYEIKDRYITYFHELPYTITLLIIRPKNSSKLYYLHYNYQLGVYKMCVVNGVEELDHILIDKYIRRD